MRRPGCVGGSSSAGSRVGSVTQRGEQGTVAPCSASRSSSSSSSAEPSASRWATGPPGQGAPSAPRLPATTGPSSSDPLSPPECGGQGSRSSLSDSPSSETPESTVSRMGERGGDASRRAPREGNVHSKDWERLQPDSLPRDGSDSGSPGRGRALSEPPSSPMPCPVVGGCNTPSEERRSPESLEGGGGLKSGPLGDCGDTGESSGPSGDPGGREALAGASGSGLGGPGYSAAASGEPGGQVTLGGSSGVPGGLAVSGDPSPGVWGEPGEWEMPSWGLAAEEGAPGAWIEVAKTSAGGWAGDSGEPGARVGEPGAGSSRGASGEPGAEAEGSAGWKGAPGAGQTGGLGEPGGPRAPGRREESCGKSRGAGGKVASCHSRGTSQASPAPKSQPPLPAPISIEGPSCRHPLPSPNPRQEVPTPPASARLLLPA